VLGQGSRLAIVGSVDRQAAALLQQLGQGQAAPAQVDGVDDISPRSIDQPGRANSNAQHWPICGGQQVVNEPVHKLQGCFP